MNVIRAADVPWGGATLPESGSEPFPPSWRLLDDVAVMTLPDPAFLVHNMIHDKGIGAVYSPPGTGKTTVLADLGIVVPTGGRFFGHPVLDPGSVVYVGAEDPAGFKVRLRAAKAARGLRPDMAVGCYTFPEAVDMRDADSVAAFGRFMKAQRFELPLKAVIVDTYAASTPGANENSAEDTTVAMAHAVRWRDELDCAVILAHHTNAGGTRERGHSAMRGACDFMISMTPLDDLVLMECSKLRNGSPFEKLTLKLVPAPDGLPGMVFKLASDVLPSSQLTDNERRAVEALRDTFRAVEGATKTEWQTACVGMAASTFYRVAKTLSEKGYVEAAGPRFRPTGKAATW